MFAHRTVHQMVALVLPTEHLFDLLVAGEVERVRRPRAVHHDVDALHGLPHALVANDAVQGVRHAPVVRLRVGQQALHARLQHRGGTCMRPGDYATMRTPFNIASKNNSYIFSFL